MAFINDTGAVGELMALAVENIFGSWYAFGFFSFLLIIIVAIVLRISLVWIVVLLIPFNLVFLAYGIIPVYLGAIFMLVIAFLLAFGFSSWFKGFT